ncbi:carnitinyl-CoA dehydratase [Aspergillus flavus AF70]|nr:carnitinyl-CoA dehydratase [Aspergillus flavus AF70]
MAASLANKVFAATAPSSSIVNVTSLYGIKGAPLLGPCCMSKLAIIRLTEAAAYEAGPSNTRGNAVCP